MEETGKKAETKSKKLAKTKKKSMPSVKERVVAFWKGVKAEFRKIIWPSKESLKNQTIAVLVVLYSACLSGSLILHVST